MPIYEYYCQKCDEVRELWQSIYEADSKKCPDCEIPMHKLISRSSFQLKGGGWYADGYCRKKDEKCTEKKTAGTPGCGSAGIDEKSACSGCH